MQTGYENAPKMTINDTIIFFSHCNQHFGNLTITVSECCLIKLLPYILFEKYIYILALEMASPGNRHCANCIGALSFPITTESHGEITLKIICDMAYSYYGQQ